MAVFLVNTCKFNSCGITFPTLTELIKHIEDTHLDFDPRFIEQHELQQPQSLPISYILRVFAENSKKDSIISTGNNQSQKKTLRSQSPAPSLSSATPTGSEMDEDNESDSAESSIDSWSNVNNEGDSAIIKIMSSTSHNMNDEKSKPYICAIGGCKKRYRNANGLKYHSKFVHKNQNKETTGPVKMYKCHCGKNYKTSHGLKNHTNLHHNKNQTQSSQTQTQTQFQIQTEKVTKTDQSTTTNNSPLQANTKESILATFVRMKASSIQSNTLSPTSPTANVVSLNRNTLDGLPLVLTLQTDKSNKFTGSTVTLKANEISETEKKFPVIAAPTLQQHLLSPIITKLPSSTKVVSNI